MPRVGIVDSAHEIRFILQLLLGVFPFEREFLDFAIFLLIVVEVFA